ncbi:hypothetical protein DM01DRAFT_1087819 [Hesseltinella vesiculosa]|uniref:Uncharacterized protein n=1 Tax=Hesseltinella vesiculosa TaxID=101127 RepID=A0A1X2GDH4_9FUNG|nr:hypothetical protein DM01DRAFT_1087819 [Hesseltinella vesiculosa]
MAAQPFYTVWRGWDKVGFLMIFLPIHRASHWSFWLGNWKCQNQNSEMLAGQPLPIGLIFSVSLLFTSFYIHAKSHADSVTQKC